MKKQFSILFFFLIAGCYAQDIHLSQFYASPLLLNPANTARFEGDWRIINNFRNQWNAIPVPYNTFALGFDKKFTILEENVGLGIQVVNDKSAGLLSLNKILLSGSYQFNFSGNLINLGIQAGPSFRRFSYGSLTFPNQFDNTSGNFNNQITNNEINLSQNLTYFDVNTGVMWSKDFNRFEPEAGYSAFHLNKPKESFLHENNRIPIRQMLYSGVRIKLTSQWYIFPRVLYMIQNNNNNLLMGTNLYFVIPGNHIYTNTVFAGSYFRAGYKRNTDASVIVGGVKIQNIEVGISYDVNISNLATATKNRGAFELSIIYISGRNLLKNRTIPCDRL